MKSATTADAVSVTATLTPWMKEHPDIRSISVEDGERKCPGRPLSKIFTDKEEALNVIEKAILLFREQGQTGERFARTIERLGFENVEAQLLADDLLDRKQEILGVPSCIW